MATAFFRTVILYLLLIAGLRLTGKRQIGELEPIELVLTMLQRSGLRPHAGFRHPSGQRDHSHYHAAGHEHAPQLRLSRAVCAFAH